MPLNIINTESFAKLRQAHGYYVDKTDFLVQFFQDPADVSRFRSPADVTLFTRPRRFGKTLFMSMLAEFFDMTKDSRELFAGLKVVEYEKLCSDWMNQYPVISFTLKGIEAQSYDKALEAIQYLVGSLFAQYDEVLGNKNVKTQDQKKFEKLMAGDANEIKLRGALLVLTRVLFQYYGKPVILLVDEYDVPVAKAAERGYYDEMLLFMRNFLSNALKTNPYLNFAILTGALRITKESIFTGLNNLSIFDIVANKYSDVFGFTQNEVDQLLSRAGLEEKRGQYKEWYDGYHFGEREDIYCPWSIMQCLESQQGNPREPPRAYWVNTSGNELTRGFVEHVPASIQDDMASLLAGKSIVVQVNETLNYSQVYTSEDNFWTLLYLTGYLTPSSDEENCVDLAGPERTMLAIPNKEVRKAFNDEIKSWFENTIPKNSQHRFFRLFWDADAQNLEKMLTECLLLNSSFRDYQYREHFYHSLLLGIFMLGYPVTSNRESGTGVHDLAVLDKRKNRAAIIEIKSADSFDQLDDCVRTALEQIADRQYDAQLRADGCKHVFHWGMAFYKKSCRMAVRRVCA